MAERQSTILHVDDDEANRYAVTRSLTAAGFAVVEAASGQEALAKVADAPDLIILDVRLPDIPGFEVCRMIKNNPKTQHIPVLHLSASFTTSSDRTHGLEGGADAYLVRPVEPMELVATVNALLRARNVEEKLRESEARFRLLANSIPQLAWMAEKAGNIFWYNQRWYEYTGLPAGGDWKLALDPADLPRVLEKLQRSFDTGEPWEDTFRLRRHDGEFRWHLSRMLPLLDQRGNVTLWFGTNTDVTEYRQAKEDAERARALAEEANRLKDQFLATLSHELRTPLNAIVGWAQILHGADVTNEDLTEGIESIERNAKAQAQLIEDLLDVSRIISGKMRLDAQPTSVAAAIDGAIASVLPTLEARSIRLVRQIASEGVTVLGDAGRLQQVVWNLMSNAVKFTEVNGTITVKLARIGDKVEFSVTDSGQGIAQEFLPYVFDRFRQADPGTKRGKAGLGLGLAIVKQLVEAHGGSVWASSPGPGQGATFSVSLPAYIPGVSGDAAPGEAGKIASPNDPTLAGLRILVVEDENDSRVVVTRILRGGGATVVAVSSVNDAWTTLDAQHFDLLISDIAMPEQDGYDLIRRLRAERGKLAKLPAIALTAFAREDDRQRLSIAGYNAHVAKPADSMDLISAAARLTGRPAPMAV